MEILLTRQFLDEARREPSLARAVISRLAALPPPAEDIRAAAVVRDRLLGWCRGPGRLELHGLVPESALTSEFPLSDMSLGELRALGVADDLIGPVQSVRSAVELGELPLPEFALSRLRFRMLQRALGDEQRLERRAESLDHLERYLRGEITELLLNLDDTQRPVVTLPVPGTIIVRGVAGSGKTAVALHRIHAIFRTASRLSPPRILYLTFNTSLASAAAQLLVALGLPVGAVEVRNIHSWCKEFLGSSFPRHLLAADDREELIGAARSRVAKTSRSSTLWKYPASFWDEEIHRIKSQVLGGEAEYLAMPRHGAGRPLDARLRELVWRVSQEYDACCIEKRRADWDRVTRLAHDKLISLGAEMPLYDHVFVDEGQDFTAIGLRIASLLAGAPGNLMVSFDPAQSIYEKGFRWKSCGITAHGSRSITLQKNHRNTTRILDFARPLLDAIRNDPNETDGGGREDLVSPIAGQRVGSAPRVIQAPPGQEFAELARLVRDDITQKRIPPQNIAVLCYRTYKKKRILEALAQLDVLCQEHSRESEIRLADPSVKVLTMHSAKGLEFPIVYLIVSALDVQVPRSLAEPGDAAAYRGRARKVLYMAMTRALTELTLVHDESHGSPLDALLGAAAPPAASPPAVPAPKAPSKPARASEPVFAQGVTKFHRAACEHLGPAAHRKRFASRDEALRQGMKPCRTCSP